MAMLDQYTPKLLSLFHSKGVSLGHRLQVMLDVLLQVQYFQKKLTFIFSWLMFGATI